MNHMSPFGEMSLQGSVARSQSEFVPVLSGSWQFEIFGWSEGRNHPAQAAVVRVGDSSPLEPPDEKRSCCQVPISESPSLKLSSSPTQGSTSEFTKSVPDCGAPWQPPGSG